MIRFTIQFDGVIADISEALYAAHVAAATNVGWSKLDRERFRHALRTKGTQGNYLPGAKPLKLTDYHARFADILDTDESIGLYRPVEGLGDTMRRLLRAGGCTFVTLGANVDARTHRMAALLGSFGDFKLHGLTADPRQRPGELASLAGDRRRSVVLASSDTLIRAAGQVDLITVGIAGGDCSMKRLKQAGCDLAYHSLADFAEDVANGAGDLASAGVLLGAVG